MTPFEGPISLLPLPLALRSVAYEPGDTTPEDADEVRHASGYEPFVEFAVSTGTLLDGRECAAVADFITEHGDSIKESVPLRWAAGMFLGNTVIANSANGIWLVFDPDWPEVWVGESGLSVLATVDGLAAGRAGARAGLDSIVPPPS